MTRFIGAISEVEVAGKLVGGRLTGISAIAPLLFSRQEGDRHLAAISGRAASGRAAWPDPRRPRRLRAC